MVFPADNISSPVIDADPSQVVPTFQQLSEDDESVNAGPIVERDHRSAINDANSIVLERLRYDDDLDVVLLKIVLRTKASATERSCSKQTFENTVNVFQAKLTQPRYSPSVTQCGRFCTTFSNEYLLIILHSLRTKWICKAGRAGERENAAVVGHHS